MKSWKNVSSSDQPVGGGHGYSSNSNFPGLLHPHTSFRSCSPHNYFEVTLVAKTVPFWAWLLLHWASCLKQWSRQDQPWQVVRGEEKTPHFSLLSGTLDCAASASKSYGALGSPSCLGSTFRSSALPRTQTFILTCGREIWVTDIELFSQRPLSAKVNAFFAR